MASRLFGSSKGASSVKHFEIRLEQSNIIIQDTEGVAPLATLRGTLVLCLAEQLKIQNIRLRFTGERRVGLGFDSSSTRKDEVFFRHTWEFVNAGKKTIEALPAGNYEWPFELALPETIPESVEGLEDSWIIYRMKATIDRGLLMQPCLARRHVRLIRTLDADSLELSQPMSVENTWTEKIDYTLSTPSKGVVFGTSVKVDFRIVSLLKGLRIGEVASQINESQNVVANPRRQVKKTSSIREIVQDVWLFPDDAQTVEVDGQDAWVFSRQLSLPSTLRKCLQTVETLGFKIRHNLTFNVKLINPDGHTSELHATLPLHIFISPSLPLDENNELPNGSSQALTSAFFSNGAPPIYGEHRFDRLYSDLGSGYATPAGIASGVGTPFASQSRRASAENLYSMGATTATGLTATALQSRLDTINGNETTQFVQDVQQASTFGNRPASVVNRQGSMEHDLPTIGSQDGQASNEDTSQHGSCQSSSRRVSDHGSLDSDISAPMHIESSPEAMSKVPSYTTALQTLPRTPISEVPPCYTSPSEPRPHLATSLNPAYISGFD